MSNAKRQMEIDAAETEGRDEMGWLIILSDLMMLLLTFFVMLFATTSSSDQNYVGMLRQIGDALGGESLVERKSGLDGVSADIERFINDNNLVKHIQLTSEARGIVMYAQGDLFFDAGTANIKKDIKRFLKGIAGVIKKSNYKVLVEGHTDDVPIASAKYPSNWELSTARASAVIRFFISEEKIEPRLFTAVGYAHYHPRYPMIPENRSKNRRVEIVIQRERL
ncbi:Flagellar motor rotation protein MotB [hydrothermal vent metagenome]|uniref:Flagellar motor rotation protein MotB n=1 Tax=hydrothermal vent metagenome TaxID=652676 RepID=A0A3B1CMZ9_9ZZZZ